MPEFAASRAYYAMFYVAEAFLLGEGLAFSSHKAVIAGFGRHFTKPSRVPAEFHRYLVDAQEDRAAGDYGLSPGVTAEEAATHIARAQRLIELAETSLSRRAPRTGSSFFFCRPRATARLAPGLPH